MAVFVPTQGHRRGVGLGLLTALCIAGFVVNTAQGASSANAFSQSVTIGSLGLMMLAFSHHFGIIAQLCQTQHELAALAVSEERNRVAPDMHDILGHSLTVIAVNAELAGRLMESATPQASGRPGLAPGQTPLQGVVQSAAHWRPRAWMRNCPAQPTRFPPATANCMAGCCARASPMSFATPVPPAAVPP